MKLTKTVIYNLKNYMMLQGYDKLDFEIEIGAEMSTMLDNFASFYAKNYDVLSNPEKRDYDSLFCHYPNNITYQLKLNGLDVIKIEQEEDDTITI